MSLANVPDFIETERMIIRCPKLEDLQEVYEAIQESVDDLKPWMPWANRDMTLESSEENLRAAIAKFITREDLRYHCHCKETGRLLVSSGLHRIDWSVPRFEIGYWCRSNAQGKGYVTETARALATMVFEKFSAARVSIHCDDLNVKSYAVAERLGFKLEGVLRNDSVLPSGELRSTRIYALTALADLK